MEIIGKEGIEKLWLRLFFKYLLKNWRVVELTILTICSPFGKPVNPIIGAMGEKSGTSAKS